jgi:hypothetical protein
MDVAVRYHNFVLSTPLRLFTALPLYLTAIAAAASRIQSSVVCHCDAAVVVVVNSISNKQTKSYTHSPSPRSSIVFSNSSSSSGI